MKDPYQVLGVPRGATEADIKTAFRQLGRQHHPDRNPDDAGAVQRFKEINAAYQILSDPKKRALYDRFGAAGLGAARAGQGGPFQGVPIDLSDLNIDGIFGDLLDALGIRFGDRGDIQVELELGFEEAAFGCTKTIEYERLATCDRCRGTGAAAGSAMDTCRACQGRGRVRYQQGVFPIAVERSCSSCNGTGRVVATACEHCRGVGMLPTTTTVDVVIPPGIESGSTKRIERQGNMARKGRTGDVEVVVQVRPHEFFRRSGDNVLCTLPITFAQAVLGDEIEIPTLDGKGIMRVPEGTQPGTVLRIRGRGIPKRVMGGRGDQLVEVQVEIPTELSPRQKELVMELARELGEAVQPQRRTFVDKLRALFSG
jgi:molecular chaperone DnaJ